MSAPETAEASVDDLARTLVCEYLRYNGLTKTLATLEEESLSPALDTTGAPTSLEAAKDAFLHAFDLGHREECFALWGRHVPVALATRDPPTRRLEFYLHVHFAVWPYRLALTGSGAAKPTPADATRSMSAFKQFLDTTNGQALAQTPEFLVYYALPYVQSPLMHPSFQPLFAEAWLLDLRNRFSQFLDVALQGIRIPRLYSVASTGHLNMKLSGDSDAGAGSGAGTGDVIGGAVGDGPGGDDSPLNLAATSHSIVDIAKELIDAVEKLNGGEQPHSTGEVSNQVGSVVASLKDALLSQEKQLLTVSRRRGGPLGGGSGVGPADGGGDMPPDSFPDSGAIHPSGGSGLPHAPAAAAAAAAGPSAAVSVTPPMAADAPHTDYHAAPGSRITPRAGAGAAPGDAAGGAPPVAVGSHGPLAALNYAKIQADLATYIDHVAADAARTGGKASNTSHMSKSARRCCLLLQALRWRLTRSQGGKPRRVTLQLYIENDVLSVSYPPTDGSVLVLQALLTSPAPVIKDSAARLVNAVASSCGGRTYLLQDARLIENLIRVMSMEAGDTALRQNALGSLQKFSLRRAPQTQMIEAGVMEWIVHLLREHVLASGGTGRPLSEYSVEYSTALLMNLSLRRLGKERVADPDLRVLEMLSDYLESENDQVRTYVNGTLYSILALPVLKDRAREMGLDDILRGLMAHSPEQFQLQLEFILEQMATPPTEEDLASDEEEDDDVSDPEDEDDDDGGFDDGTNDAEPEGLTPIPGEPVGEVLLCSAYLAGGGAPEAAQQEMARISDWDQRSSHVSPPRPVDDAPVPQRPITPANTKRGGARGSRRRQQQQQQQHQQPMPPDMTGERPMPPAVASYRASGALGLGSEPVPSGPTGEAVPDPMRARPLIPRTPPPGAERIPSTFSASHSPSTNSHLAGSASGAYPFSHTGRDQRARLPPRAPAPGYGPTNPPSPRRRRADERYQQQQQQQPQQQRGPRRGGRRHRA